MVVVSSCRECWVKSRNERNPVVSCQHSDGHSNETAGDKSEEEVGTTSNHHAPYVLGYTRTTMAITEGSKTAMWSKSPKVAPVQIAGCNSPA